MSFAETAVLPGAPLDAATRLTALLDRAEGRVRRRFLRLVREGTTLVDLEGVALLLEQGQAQAAIQVMSQDIGPGLATALDAAYTAAGLSTAEVLRSQVDTLFDFNTTNQRAVAAQQSTRLRLVREFTSEQRLASSRFLQDAFARGLAPVEQARVLRLSIGLTDHQAQTVLNYRRQLESLDTRALTRQLRDRRFDSTLRTAAARGQPLTTAQIDRMTDRYQERWVRFRAQTIAETESLAAVGAAEEELFEQAVEAGVVQAADVVNTWRTNPPNVRASHRAMNNQKRALGEKFQSGLGNFLRFPGDPQAPAADRVRCKCNVVREVKREARSASRRGRAAA
jgi:hypothetical protein